MCRTGKKKKRPQPRQKLSGPKEGFLQRPRQHPTAHSPHCIWLQPSSRHGHCFRGTTDLQKRCRQTSTGLHGEERERIWRWQAGAQGLFHVPMPPAVELEKTQLLQPCLCTCPHRALMWIHGSYSHPEWRMQKQNNTKTKLRLLSSCFSKRKVGSSV